MSNMVSFSNFLKSYTVEPFHRVVAKNDIYGYFYLPKNPNGRIIIYCHGAFDLAKAEDYSDVVAYANAGFAVVLIKYDTEVVENINLQLDVLEAVDITNFMKSQPQFKNAKYILAGCSRGGFVAYHVAIKAGDLFNGVMVMVAPTDVGLWKQETKIPPAELNKFFHYFTAPDIIQASPITHYEKLKKCNMLLVYGQQDVTVPPIQGTLMARALGLKPNKNFFIMNDGHTLAHRKPTQEIAKQWMMTV